MVVESRPTIVGRDDEIAALQRAVDQTAEGRGGVLVLGGMPGIGKTRLVEHVAEIASNRGLTVVWGHCSEHSGAPPFWPWSQALRELCSITGSEAARSWIDASTPQVSQLVPALDMGSEEQQQGSVDVMQAEFELLESATRFLINAASTNPAVVLLEDLHWADNSTLGLLRHIARDAARHSLLIVGTYRDVELSRTHSLAETLAELQRTAGFARIAVKPLGDTSTIELINASTGTEQDPETLDSILDATGGNPLFVLEIAREMRSGEFDVASGRVPEGIREALGRRLNRVSERCNSVLQTAALLGREFDIQLLQDLSPGVDVDDLLDVLEEATQALILDEEPHNPGHYHFSHALVQQTLMAELSVTRQARLQAKIADTLETTFGHQAEANASVLAHHFVRAEAILGPDRALRYLMIAGQQALDTYALADARGHFETASELHEVAGEDVLLADIMYGVAQASSVLDSLRERQAAWDGLARAFKIYRDKGEIAKAIKAARVPFTIGGITGVPDLTGAAIPLTVEGSTDRGWALARHAIALADVGRTDEALELLGQALEIARQQGDRHLEARALAHTAQSHFRNDDPMSCLKVAAESEVIAHEINDYGTELRLAWFVARSAADIGDLDRLYRQASRSRELYDLFRHPNYEHQGARIEWLGCRLKGDYRRAEQLARNAADDRAVKDAFTYSIFRFYTELDRGLLPTDPSFFLTYETLVAGTEEVADPDDALRSAASFFAHRGTYDDAALRFLDLATELGQLHNVGAGNQQGRVERAAFDALFAYPVGDASRGRELYQRLLPAAGRRFGDLATDVNRILGRLATLNKEPEIALEHFAISRADCRDRGFPVEQGWACHDFARAALDSGLRSQDEIRTAIDEGKEIAARIGLAHLQECIAELDSELEAGESTSGANPADLSEREVEVLRLIGSGKSNQQIADELFISRHTVVRHVSNIFLKTGASNRTEATAFAHANGLL